MTTETNNPDNMLEVELSRLRADKAELVEALKALMGGDEKMQVTIGGNPNYVDKFIARTNGLIAKHTTQSSEAE